MPSLVMMMVPGGQSDALLRSTIENSESVGPVSRNPSGYMCTAQ